jgi:hypothetical protein
MWRLFEPQFISLLAGFDYASPSNTDFVAFSDELMNWRGSGRKTSRSVLK